MKPKDLKRLAPPREAADGSRVAAARLADRAVAEGLVDVALAMGQQLNVPLPTTSTTNEFLTAARAMGYAEKDFAVIFDVLGEMAGVKR